MNKNDQNYMVQKIRSQYTQQAPSRLENLRALDARVHRPANVFAYAFGTVAALIMGAGMSLVMTDIGAILSISHSMVWGVAAGLAGMTMALLTYPIYKAVLNARKKKFGPQILALSEELMDGAEA